MTSTTPSTGAARASALAELDRSLAFYDRKSAYNKRGYTTLRIVTMALAAAIPVVAAFDGSPRVTAILGALIVVNEGLQQLFQFHDRWVDYRTAWNGLERERRLHQSLAGPYAGTDDPDRLLAERIEAVMALENADWTVDAAAKLASAESDNTAEPAEAG